MKKFLFALAMLALLFAPGCTGDAPSNSQNNGQPAAEKPAPEPGGGEQTSENQPAEKPAEPVENPGEAAKESPAEGLPAELGEEKQAMAPAKKKKASLDAADWTEISDLDRSIAIDIKYATTNNFTKSKIYDCPRCFLRPDAARAIAAAHKTLKANGLGLKMFDCYRPRPYQQRLWDKVPNPDYVTPPAKGSMHSRGAAVDLTIVDKNGNELDMGTPYDFFGQKAHSDFTDLPEKVLQNRRLLKKTMEAVGFRGIRTEWWHFSFGKKEFELSSVLWDCE